MGATEGKIKRPFHNLTCSNWDEKTRRFSIPYVIDNDIGELRELIYAAMEEIQNNSRISFKEVSNIQGKENCLRLHRSAGCFFQRDKEGGGKIPLCSGCHNYGIVLHELLHSLGFKHEQQRFDRDRHVNIFHGNIESDAIYQFDTVSDEEYGWSNFPFDYDSIMLYGNRSFAKNKKFKTMEAINGLELLEVDTKKGLSEMDKEKLMLL